MKNYRSFHIKGIEFLNKVMRNLGLYNSVPRELNGIVAPLLKVFEDIQQIGRLDEEGKQRACELFTKAKNLIPNYIDTTQLENLITALKN